jgi:hypothetical protein
MAATLDPHQWQRLLAELLDTFDFTRPGADQSLGRELAVVVHGIQRGAAEDQSEPHSEWPENSTTAPPKGGCKCWKHRKYGIENAPNFRAGQMLNFISLMGRTRIGKKLVEMVYGRNEALDRSTSPNKYISERDKLMTDMEKAKYAHEGQSIYKIKRPFYGFGPGEPEDVSKCAQESLNEWIRETNRANGY